MERPSPRADDASGYEQTGDCESENSDKERPRRSGSTSQVECELNRDETLPSERVRFGTMMPPEGRFQASDNKEAPLRRARTKSLGF